MRWISLTEAALGTAAQPDAAASAETRPDPAALSAEYRAGRSIGVVTLGERHLFFRRVWRAYYIPYGRISRLFRRVIAVPAKIGCCNTGEIRVENLVVCGLAADGTERELAQIQLPGERAAAALMEDLRRLAPGAAFGKPSVPADTDRREDGDSLTESADSPEDMPGAGKEAGA